ncbi:MULTISPECIES: 2-dehydro-3-deoxy-D-gluconate 5-dehydrogenase KduD [unclassified Microbacterium]|uniref:2-dehydro-3-deoxy-D-gluconate 5-dehydrogenase KduD n=1 Tax=unclassified Microbacterium TaxID=2609290 RepID=UPI00301A7EFB
MIVSRFRLDGRTAMVTGSRRGLGRAVALALAEAGADLILVDRGDASDTARAVQALGRRVHGIGLDLASASPAEMDAAVTEAAEVFGGLDILVNNAGTIRRAPAVAHAAEDWDEVIAVNLSAVFHLTQAAGRRMLAQGHGRIINVASMLSFQGGILVPGYAASKHGIAGLTKAFANEWAAGGVTVNAVAPGYMATDNTAALREDPAREAEILRRIPAERWGRPDDVQGAFVFLASDASAYVTGVVLPVDGGWLVR